MSETIHFHVSDNPVVQDLHLEMGEGMRFCFTLCSGGFEAKMKVTQIFQGLSCRADLGNYDDNPAFEAFIARRHVGSSAEILKGVLQVFREADIVLSLQESQDSSTSSTNLDMVAPA